MKNIEIKTTQNVVLQYELANLRDRIIAFLLDFACLGVTMLILGMIGAGATQGNETAGVIFGTFLACIFLFNSLAFEVWNNGQSLGKMALRIQVIKTAGGRATFSDYSARWIFRMIDIYFSLGGIACILVASSSKAQRIGDIVANTDVVKLIPKMDLTLKDILNLHGQDSYKPTYPEAKKLIEDDVLLVKSTLDRYRRFRNEAHEDAIELMAKKIKEVLEVESVHPNSEQFLQTILKDYVVLTR